MTPDALDAGGPAPDRTDRMLAAALGASLVLVFIFPYARMPSLPCPFRWLTGLPCLSCGGTRAANALSRFALSEAFILNPLVVSVFVLSAAFVLWTAARAFFGWPRRPLGFGRPPASMLVRVGVPISVVLNWVYLIAVER